MDSSVSSKDEIWFLHVCDHISNAVYLLPKSSSGLRKDAVHSYETLVTSYEVLNYKISHKIRQHFCNKYHVQILHTKFRGYINNEWETG